MAFGSCVFQARRAITTPAGGVSHRFGYAMIKAPSSSCIDPSGLSRFVEVFRWLTPLAGVV